MVITAARRKVNRSAELKKPRRWVTPTPMRPSAPTVLGLLVAVATSVVAFAVDSPLVMFVVFAVCFVGWAVFAFRDLIAELTN